MLKITLTPLDEKVVRILADKRGLSIDTFISNMIREEAAIELASWRHISESGEVHFGKGKDDNDNSTRNVR